MGVNSGISKEWKVETEEGREHIRTKVVNQSGLIAAFDASIKRSFRNDGVWYDISGQDNHLLLTNVGYTTDAKGGLTFSNGTSSGVSMKPFINNLVDGYTMSVWIKHTGTVSIARAQRYVTIDPTAVIRHSVTAAANLQTYAFNTVSASGTIDVANQIFTNQYYHIVATYDARATTNNMALYRNGTLIGTSNLAGTLRQYLSLSLSNSIEFFQGNMYAMTIYNRALTQTEIKRNYLSTYDRFF